MLVCWHNKWRVMYPGIIMAEFINRWYNTKKQSLKEIPE